MLASKICKTKALFDAIMSYWIYYIIKKAFCKPKFCIFKRIFPKIKILFDIFLIWWYNAMWDIL